VLPGWRSVLAVGAHPADESFGLGAVLDAFAHTGARASVLCLTHGEASTVHAVAGDLAAVRARELQDAARLLQVSSVVLHDHPDGALAAVPRATRAAEVIGLARATAADGLLVFDPSGVSGHPDHVAATAAALASADELGLPVLGWTLPRLVADRLNDEFGTSFSGDLLTEDDLALPVCRERQRQACQQHASQAVPTSVLWRRLELLQDVEHLRWLRRAAPLEPGSRGGTRAGRTEERSPK
jgi:LmbE family N-acetylglucosaminyl deacetylase